MKLVIEAAAAAEKLKDLNYTKKCLNQIIKTYEKAKTNVLEQINETDVESVDDNKMIHGNIDCHGVGMRRK